LGSKPSKTEEKTSASQPGVLPPFYLVILKSVSYFCFCNVLFVTDFYGKFGKNAHTGLRQKTDTDRQRMDRRRVTESRNVVWRKITYFV